MDGAGPTLAPGTCLESWDGGNHFEGTLWEQDETTRVRHRELACCTANTQTLSSDRARLGTSQKRPPRKVFFFEVSLRAIGNASFRLDLNSRWWVLLSP